MTRGCLRTCSWGLWERSGLTGGQHRKGAARLLRRARGDATEREKEGSWVGEKCLPCTGDDGELTGGEEAATEGFDDGGGSGGAPVSSGRGCHGRRRRRPAATRACQAPSDPKSQGEQAGGLALHRRRRIDGDGGDPRRRRGKLVLVRAR
jgi:hypothetical protein